MFLKVAFLDPFYTYSTLYLPTDGNYFTAIFADDTALLAVENTVEESTLVLQSAIGQKNGESN